MFICNGVCLHLSIILMSTRNRFEACYCYARQCPIYQQQFDEYNTCTFVHMLPTVEMKGIRVASAAGAPRKMMLFRQNTRCMDCVITFAPKINKHSFIEDNVDIVQVLFTHTWILRSNLFFIYKINR